MIIDSLCSASDKTQNLQPLGGNTMRPAIDSKIVQRFSAAPTEGASNVMLTSEPGNYVEPTTVDGTPLASDVPFPMTAGHNDENIIYADAASALQSSENIPEWLR